MPGLHVAGGPRRYLDEACRGDATLRERVEELLLARRQAGSFLGGRWMSATEELAIAESPGTVIGPYKLLEQIGEGGIGRRLHGRADRAGPADGGAQDHQAGHGHAGR